MSRKKKTHPKKANRKGSDIGSRIAKSQKLQASTRINRFFILLPIVGLVILVIIALNQQAIPTGATKQSPSTFSTNNFVHSPDEEEMSEEEIAVDLLSDGTALLNEGRIEEALEIFYHSLDHDPESEDGHYNIAIALARFGRLDKAIGHYEEALRIFPDYAEAHNNLGNILVERGDIPKAIEHFEESLEIFPDSAATHNNFGKALGMRGNMPKATSHFATAVRMEPSYVEAHYNLGNAYLALGRTDEAISEFTIVLNLRPGFEPALRAMSRAQQKKALQ